MQAGRSNTSIMEPPPPPPPLLQLPDPALQAVLQQLSTRDVLNAARSCSQLRAAAAAALDRIATGCPSLARIDSLMLHLEHHGQHVSNLGVRLTPSITLTRLPLSCSRLQALTLEGGRVQLGASNRQPGVLQAASALTSLWLSAAITVADSPEGAAAAVARLTRLQCLELVDGGFAGGGVLPGSMLAPLTALTYLALGTSRSWLQAATLAHLSSLNGLQELQLSGHALGPALTALQHLQQLTTLVLVDVDAPRLTGLSTSLQELVLLCCSDLDPLVLAGCTQLRRLHLEGCRLVGPQDSAALLAHLQQCAQLTNLQLHGGGLHDQLPAPAYVALTASSSLEVLEWACSELPAAALQPMFGGSKRLAHLRALWLSLDDSAAAGVPLADLPALVSCCPALQDLWLLGLQGMTVRDLLPLTVLTGLTALLASGSSSGPQWDVEFETPAGQPPDVASQLLEAINQAAQQAPAT